LIALEGEARVFMVTWNGIRVRAGCRKSIVILLLIFPFVALTAPARA
jgi:hypothetical protein